jgi:arylsulfatase A-like enzyme
MKRLTVVPAVLALMFASVLHAAERPDVVLIMVDDMGLSDIGCYGGEIQTPNIDSLAAGGVRFDQFYNSGRCCPTRATLLTGLHPHQTGIGHMTLSPGNQPKKGPENYQGFLNRQCLTIAEALGQSGYETMMAGKWHLGMHDESLWPKQRGFEHFFGTLAGATRFFHPIHPRGMTMGNTAIEMPESTTDEAFYTTDAYTDHAIGFIKQHQDSDSSDPYFLYLAYTAPHWPLQAFEDDIARYRGKYKGGWGKLRQQRYERQVELGLIDESWQLSDSGEKIPDWDSLTAAKQDEMDLKMAVYAAMVDRVDQNIGKLVEHLKAAGTLDTTLILFLSDNGGCAEGGMLGRGEFFDVEKRNSSTNASYGEAWANASNTPFRLYKHYAHEGGTATPFFMHWPSGIARQTQWYRQPAQLIDVMPTLLDVAGADYRAEFSDQAIHPIDGVSLRPSFEGQPLNREEPIFIEHEGNAFVRDGQWKLVGRGVAGAKKVDAATWELYNMQSDRTETTDLSDESPEKVIELANKWDAWAERVGVFPKRTRQRKQQPAQKKPMPTTTQLQAPEVQSSAPNFVFILTDDQGWTGLSVPIDKNRPDSKSDYYQSPNIARLASQGMRFSQGYSPAPNCSPSRYANLTGKTCARLLFTDIVGRGHVTDLKGKQKLRPGGKGTREIRSEDITIPELLKTLRHGYQAAHFGKWHLKGGGPEKHGFDVSDGATGNREGNQGETANDDPKRANSITKRACDFIDAATEKKQPFYCQVSHYAVHAKIQHRADTLASLKDRPVGEAHSDPTYAAMVEDLDSAVGILLDKLDNLGIADNTYVIYQADNGSPKFMSESPPLRRFKPEIWEGGVRVPTFMRGPGIAANSQCDAPMMGIDLLPTIWELAGGNADKLPPNIDGGSLVSVAQAASVSLLDNSQAARPTIDRPGELVVHSPHYVTTTDLAKNQRPSSSIYDGKWKLVAWYDTGDVHLFNLDSDISESTDVSDQHPDVKRDLWTRLRDYLAEVNAKMPTLDPLHPTHSDAKPEDADADGLPDTWEFQNLLTHRFDAFDDPDVDGKSNAQELAAETDPLSRN